MIAFTVSVKPVTKKNSQVIIPITTKNGKTRHIPIPSSQYREFETQCKPYFNKVLCEVGQIRYPINVKCVFYVEKRLRYDLTNLLEAVDDSMTKARLLLDDNRDIIAGHDGSRVYQDKENPRIEIEITELKDYVQWNNTKDVQTNLF